MTAYCVSGICAGFSGKGVAATTTEVVTDTTRSTPASLSYQVSVRALASFIGKIISGDTGHPAPLHYCSLQQLKYKALRVSGFDGLTKISPPAQEDLE